MDLNNMMTLSDGRRVPPDAFLRLFALEMHTLLRGALHIVLQRGEDRTATEYALCHIISETLNTIEQAQPAQEAQPSPPAQAS